MKTDNLEFHYVVSYREGEGWGMAVDVEQAKFPEGTIYVWEQGEGWTFPKDSEMESLDTERYAMLGYALRLLNEGAINA